MKINKKVAIYARVSTNKQEVDMQLHESRGCCKRSGWGGGGALIDVT